jgi:plastocyanin
MHRILLPLTVAAAATAMLAFLMPAGSAADNPTLQASVGPGFTISLKDANGAAVKHLDPGTYSIHVVDQGVEHNFHLEGSGVDEATSVEDTGEVTWTVTFIDGQVYHFQCDAHASSMKGDFGVGSGSVPPPPPPPAPPPSGFAKGTKLKGTVGPGFTISLKDAAGKVVRKVKAGKKYTVAIADKSASHNFDLYGPGVHKKTSVGKKANATWKVKFKKGKTYRFRCDAHPTIMKGTFKAS